MLTTFKSVLAAAVIAVMAPMAASAATVTLVSGGAANNFTIGDALFGGSNGITGAGSLEYSLDAVAPKGTVLDLQVVTQAFLGKFVGLSIDIDGTFATLQATQVGSRIFGITSIFDASSGFSKTLTISWTGVTTGVFNTGTPAVGFLIQAGASAVPVPAAGLLLLTALGGAAALRRRKTAAAA